MLDPFCGSGTTLVASKLLNRKFIGIDMSKDAIEITNSRLENPIKTESELLNKGIEKYQNKSENEISILKAIGAIPVQRNTGIDGFILNKENNQNIAIKIQKNTEGLYEAQKKLVAASKVKECNYKVLIKTHDSLTQQQNLFNDESVKDIIVLDTYENILQNSIKKQL